jgi:hypothetical protein
MNELKLLALGLAVVPVFALAQIAGVAGSQQQPSSTRPASPNRGIDLTSLNPAQRILQKVMVRVQQAGIYGDEIAPVSRRIVIGMNYVMRISLTPRQQAAVDAQVWRHPAATLGKEWDRVKNSGTIVSALANLSPAQTEAIGRIYNRCGVNWDAFHRMAGPSATPARKVEIMYDQQDEYLNAVRAELNGPQRAEWDRLVKLFEAEMRAAVSAR